MKLAMISQPMSGLTEEEILKTRNRAVEYLKSNGYEVVDTLFDETHLNPDLNIKNILVFYLSKSIEKMSTCDAVYFCKGWGSARGCLIEYQVALRYGLELLYEN